MDGRARRRRPWPRRAPEVADGLLGLGVVAVQLLLLGFGVNQGAPAPFVDLNGLAVALILLQGLPLTWRRRYPLGVFGVVLAANTAYYAIGFPPSQFDFGLPLAVFSVAAERDRRTSLAALATVQGLMAVQWAAGLGPYWSSANWVRVLYLLFFFSAMWAWGGTSGSGGPTPRSWPPGPRGPSATASWRRTGRWPPSGPGSPASCTTSSPTI
jgi:hypothetical protein